MKSLVSIRRYASMILLIATAFTLFFSFHNERVNAADEVEITPFILGNGYTYLPLRTSSELLGYDVIWDSDKHAAFVNNQTAVTEYVPLESGSVTLIDDKVYVDVDLFCMQQQLRYEKIGHSQLVLHRAFDVNIERMLSNLSIIASKPRPAPSSELEAAREFITSKMHELGFEVTLQPVFPPEAFLSVASHIHEPNPEPVGYNIIARKPAQDSFTDADVIVLTAQYDSDQHSSGSHSNGSGVVALLEIAENIRGIPSHVELRMIFTLDRRISGTNQYVSSLTSDEISRIVAMIELNAFGSKAVSDVMLYTRSARYEFISTLFAASSIFASSDTTNYNNAFYALAIPNVRVSDDISAVSEHMHMNREAFDTLEAIDPDRLSKVAIAILEVVHNLMIDNHSYRGYQDTTVHSEQIGSSLPLDDRFDFRNITMKEIEEWTGISLTQGVIMPDPASSGSGESSYSAYLDWWGSPLLTTFVFQTERHILKDISVVVHDASQLIYTLDRLYPRFNNVEEYAFNYVILPSFHFPTEVKSDCIYWRSNSGISYALESTENEASLTVSNFRRDRVVTIHGNDAWYDELSDLEAAAWLRVEPLLAVAGLEDDVLKIAFIDDGKGGITFDLDAYYLDLTSIPSSFTVLIDAVDIASSEGALSSLEKLHTRFVETWSMQMFQSPEQISMLSNYTPHMYLEQYIESFGMQWVSAYIRIMSEDVHKPYAHTAEMYEHALENPSHLSWMMTQDLADAFVFYMTDNHPVQRDQFFRAWKDSLSEIYGAEYQDALFDFFGHFDELLVAKKGVKDAFVATKEK